MDIRREALVSPCGQYRYNLDRRWYRDGLFTTARIGHPIPLVFVMLNPSTADALQDDATIRRCISFAQREGYEWIKVINLYAGRATKPADLFKMSDPEGPENRKQWALARDWSRRGSHIICGWGASPNAREQAAAFLGFMATESVELHCLGTTKDGSPRHPLYLPKDAALIRFKPQGGA